jgi:general nucleoside transport system ATP-binding protein
VETSKAIPLIEFREITKYFGPVVANKSVSFSIADRAIHGIVGENGAGKSTIMKILYGLYPPEEGEIRFRGKSVRILEPTDAIALGIGMVHQHFMLVPTLSVWQNVVLGAEPTLGKLPENEILEKLQALQEGFGFSLPLSQKVEELSVGQQQQVEILKLLYRNAETLILDEPTAVLTPQETDALFDRLKRLSQAGKTIILITHKLREILSFTNFVTVMRRGQAVETLATSSLTEATLAEKIIGRKQEPLPHKAECKTRAEALSVLHISAENKNRVSLKDISFTLHTGEIVGIAGIEGNGQKELVEVLAGLCPFEGQVKFFESDVSHFSPYELRQKGFALIPPDRQQDGLVLEFSVEENFRLGHHKEHRFFGKGPLYSKTKCEQAAQNLIQKFDVRPPSSDAPMWGLSGGNQQKVIVGRETENAPKFLLACHPTRGVDIGAIQFIHSHFLNLRREGTAILLISSELDEILALSDRILVLSNGKISGQCLRKDATEKQLGLWMAGGDQ